MIEQRIVIRIALIVENAANRVTVLLSSGDSCSAIAREEGVAAWVDS